MIHTTTTPAGYTIEFEDGLPDPETGKGKRRCYLVNGEKFVSVTTALGILEKAGLQWAAEKLTVAAAIELAKDGELPLHVDGALSRMKKRGLRFRQIWDAKADRGTATHEDLVKLATGETPPELSAFPAEQRGFIQGVSAWYADCRPEVLESEVMVASVEHRLAGRFDLLARLERMLPPGVNDAVVRIDLKTSENLPRYADGRVRPPFPDSLLQLAAYELCAVESGYGASDLQAVLRVDSEGAYDLYVTQVSPEWYLAVLGAYRAVNEAKAA